MLLKTLKENKLFFIPYLVLLLFLIPVLLTFQKGDLHLIINRHHNAFFDVLFAWLTFVGDGLFIIIPAVIILFVALRHSVFILAAYFSTGLITQILKRVFFEDALRPSKLLKDAGLYLIPGVDMLSGRSFPSGHATSAFALFLCLALIIRNRYMKLMCFLIACMVAFSRVYLSQHFLVDVTAGSIIGCAGTLAMYLIFYKDDRAWHAWTPQKVFNHEKRA
jgi:membrane-associated phospholipid phosphatase